MVGDVRQIEVQVWSVWSWKCWVKFVSFSSLVALNGFNYNFLIIQSLLLKVSTDKLSNFIMSVNIIG